MKAKKMSGRVELRDQRGWYCEECRGPRPVTVCHYCATIRDRITVTHHPGDVKDEFRCWDCVVRATAANCGNDRATPVADARMRRFGVRARTRCEGCGAVRVPGFAPDDIDQWVAFEEEERENQGAIPLCHDGDP